VKMVKKILYLPLDERPCNYSFPAQIAAGADDIELIRPDKDILGLKKRPADFEKIHSFLLENAAQAQSLIISADMLLYGGIVPSRLHKLETDELEYRLSVLTEIKKINPAIKIYAFALIMRCPSYSSADEEPDYYEYCGKEIFLTGQVRHKRELNLISEEEAERLLKEYSKKIGANLADFESRREKNLAMLVKIVEKVGTDIDFLLIPQDDSSPYGYTTRDREKLKKIIAQRKLADTATYPGADEAGMTLLSRAVCEMKGVKPEIKCLYAAESAKNTVPLYEDRELYKTLACQIEAAGCTQAEDGDITLFLNYPAKSPVESGEVPSSGYDERNLKEFCEKIARTVEDGKYAAVADGAYTNGGDAEFLELLSRKISLFSLSSYAGWNTSSNTLGTAICQAVFVYLYGKNRAQNEFLAERIYEDVGYCAHTRRYMCEKILPSMGLNYFDAGAPEGGVADKVKEETQRYVAEILPAIARKYEIDLCRMPWSRMFEVELTVKEKKPVVGVWHRPNDTGEETRLEGIISVLERFKAAGINLVFLESFYHGAAAYRSEIVPYNAKLGYEYGDYPDYLSAFVAEAKKRGIEVHAWVEDFYIGIEENFFTRNYPELLLKTEAGEIRQSEGNGYFFLDPANGETCRLLTEIYTELLSVNPDIKGLNLDYIRYPLSSEDDDTGYTEAALRDFGSDPKKDYEKWVCYRADKITEFVKDLRGAVKEKFPRVKFSTAVFPERELSYKTKKQDFSKWLKEGYLDFVTPMAYYDDLEALEKALIETMCYCGNTPCLAGLSCTYHNLAPEQICAQIDKCLGLGADGVVFFGSKSIVGNNDNIKTLNKKFAEI